MKTTIQQALTAHQEGRLEEAERLYNSILNEEPNNLDANNNLGVLLQSLNRFNEAKDFCKKAIELKPNYAEAHYNLGISLEKLNRFEESEASFRKVLELKPNFAEAYNGLGNTLSSQPGREKEAEESFKKALIIKPDFISARYNLGLLLHLTKQHKKAANELKLINFKNSNEFLLRCFFELNEKSNFYNHLDSLTDKIEVNAFLGSLISRSSIRFGVNKINPFCNEPLNYILKTDLKLQCDFKNTFVKNIKDILQNNNIKKKYQSLLTNGIQTSGNIFSQTKDSTEEIKNIIYSEIEKYRTHFQTSNEGFLKNWPKDFYINGWIVSMKSGGNLSPHMHEMGWLSGSIYINVPQKSKIDSGNLVVCIENEITKEREDVNPQKSIDVVTGSFCLFPSSLLHYTIPFNSEEERIVLAFDVIPK